MERIESFLALPGSFANSRKRSRYNSNSTEDHHGSDWVDQRDSADSHNQASPERPPVTRQLSRGLVTDLRGSHENVKTFKNQSNSRGSQATHRGSVSDMSGGIEVQPNASTAGFFKPQQNGNRTRQDMLNELRRMQRENEELTKEVRRQKNSAENEKRRLITRLMVAKTEIAQLRVDLEGCKERIFRLQPQNQVSDTQIGRQYRDLCEAIADWVDSDFGELDGYLQTFSKALFPPEIFELLKDHVFASGEMAVIINHPSAESYMTRFIIHAVLHNTVLVIDQWFLGISFAAERLLSSIEVGMRNLVPKRDEEIIGGWKAECYKAMLQDPELCEKRAGYLQRVERALVCIFQTLIPDAESWGFNVNKCHDLVQLAAGLAVSIRSSSSTYRFEYPFFPNDDPSTLALFEGELGSFRMIENVNGHAVRNAGGLIVGADGKTGEKLCVIHPSLIRMGQDGAANLTLEKAMILVKLDYPQSRKGQHKV